MVWLHSWSGVPHIVARQQQISVESQTPRWETDLRTTRIRDRWSWKSTVELLPSGLNGSEGSDPDARPECRLLLSLTVGLRSVASRLLRDTVTLPIADLPTAIYRMSSISRSSCLLCAELFSDASPSNQSIMFSSLKQWLIQPATNITKTLSKVDKKHCHA